MHKLRTLSIVIAIFAILGTTAAQATVTGFVTRTGNKLILNGTQFRFSGTNLYWLGLDENDAGIGYTGVSYPTNFRVDDALATAAEMGATVVRAHTLAASVGNPLALEPSLGTFNSTAFQYTDYAIYSAGLHGIRLQIPLVDNYNYYSGGKPTFCGWRGDSNYDDFFTNSTIIGDFEQFISTILNHVNPYTGLAYKNDPTIMTWETGNELSMNNGALPPTAWTQTISNYIKSIDSNHLVMDGSHGINSGSLSLSNVDIYTNHYYPLNSGQLNTDANTTGTAGKVFVTGEYAWSSGDLNGFLNAALANANVSGDLYWSLFGHLDNWGYEQHTDGYTLHYPGDNTTMQSDVQLFRAHAYAMRGATAPAVATPAAPLITAVDVNGTVAWRGAAVAATYQLERSTAGSTGPWTTVTNSLNDNQSPWADSTHPGGSVWYRIKGINLSGVSGPYSPVYSAVLVGGSTNQLADPFNDFSNIFAMSPNWDFDTTNPAYFNGDASRAKRVVASTTEYLTYHLTNIGSFTIRSWTSAFSPYGFDVAASPDNVNWTAVPTSISGFALGDGGVGNWSYYDISNLGTLAPGMNYLRIMVSGGAQFWFPQLGQATIVYGSWAALPPAAPTGLTATGGNTQVSLSWTASANAASYNIYRGTSAGGESGTAIATGVTLTSYTNTGLTNGSVYYYKVAAVNASGTSGMSNEATATPHVVAPAPPTGLIASSGNAQVGLSWTASAGAASYSVYRGTTAGGESGTAIATGITSASYTNTGLTNGITYYYKVAAVNTGGTSGQSNEASATPSSSTTTVTDPLNDWTIVSSKSSGWQFDTTNTPSFNGDTSRADRTVDSTQYLIYKFSGITTFNAAVFTKVTVSGVKFYSSIDNGATFQAITVNTGSGTAYTDWFGYHIVPSGALPAGTNALKVEFNTGTGNNWDPQLSQIAITYVGGSGGTAPSAPTGLSATAGNAQVSLSWTASSGATSYNVYRGTTAGGESMTAIATGITSTSYINTGLTNGTAYFYKVAAVNATGTSSQSNEASAAPNNSTYIQLVNRNTGTAITTSGGFQVAAYVAGATAQQWTLTPTGDGYFYLINHSTGGAITTDGGFQMTTFASGFWGQEWAVTSTGDGYYYLVNRNTNTSITTDGGFQVTAFQSGFWGQEWAQR